jgi:hypothetical protein
LSSIKIIEIARFTTRYSFLVYFHYAPDAAYLKINPMEQALEKRHRTTKTVNFISTSDGKQRKVT